MKKYLFILFLACQLLFSWRVEARPLFYVHVEEFTCAGAYYDILFSVINGYTYDQDVTVAFKVVRDGQVVGCNWVDMVVPKESDGSKFQEITVDVPCMESEKTTTLKSMLFPKDRKNRVGFWLSDCP